HPAPRVGRVAASFVPTDIGETAKAAARDTCTKIGKQENHEEEKNGSAEKEQIIRREAPLGRDFVPRNLREDATHRFGAGQGKRHIPKVDLAGKKFHPDMGLAVAPALD